MDSNLDFKYALINLPQNQQIVKQFPNKTYKHLGQAIVKMQGRVQIKSTQWGPYLQCIKNSVECRQLEEEQCLEDSR